MVIEMLLRKLNIAFVLAFILSLSGLFGATSIVMASSTSSFTQTINAGSLSVDIVDASYATVGSPVVAMGSETFSFTCGSASGTLGAATEQIYVKNPDASDTGWNIQIAASSPTAVWNSAGTDFDFNDPGSSGCVDDGATTDVDSLGGEMTIDPSGATLDVGACSTCVVTNVSLGTSDAFEEGTTDSITLLTGAGTSDDIGDWTLEGVAITQTIPAEQPAASDYSISLTISVNAT